MQGPPPFQFFWVLLLSLCIDSYLANYDGPLYDSSAFTMCQEQPEEPLYGGGLLKYQVPGLQPVVSNSGSTAYWPAFVLQHLTQGTIYTFSS
ncbi:hypothetical protein NMG60_11015804 [Bertholletia excelsa]